MDAPRLSRATATVLRARPSQEWLIRVLQGVVLILLLVVGLIFASTVAWIAIAIPMTMIVLLFLREIEESRARSSTADEPEAAGDGPDLAAAWSALHSSDHSPVVVVRRPVPRSHDEQALAARSRT